MKDTNVFISYGHGTLENVVVRLVNDLRLSGYNVFLDTDYLDQGDWETVIDEHILMSKNFLFLNSARSTSKSGYCLNELCRALEVNSKIIPILLEDIPVPLSINKLERMSLVGVINSDGTIMEDLYDRFFRTLAGVLSGKLHLKFSDSEIRLKTYLKPVDSKEHFKHYSTFCGREEAFEAFENFLNTSKVVFWVNSGPGMGKTAFSSMLSWRYPQHVKAMHFCKFNNSDRVNPKIIITSIAYQLATSIPEYKEKLLAHLDLDSLFEKNAARLFEYLIIDPCNSMSRDSLVVIVIDALDECFWRQSNEICMIFQRMQHSVPAWMKFVITSRNETEIRRILLPVSTECILTAENTRNDLRLFYKEQFPEADEDSIEVLLDKSENSFLYATEIIKQIKEENLNFDNVDVFPVGIYGYFNDCFSRIFSSENEEHLDFNKAKPILEILCATPEPASITFLQKVLNVDMYDIKSILAKMSGLFPLHKNIIEPLHKSLIDWLTNDDVSQSYYISKRDGYRELFRYIERVYEEKKYGNNRYVLNYFGKIFIEMGELQRLFEYLNDYDFLKKSIESCEFDLGIANYLEYLGALPDDKRYEAFGRSTFMKIFVENRRLLYNSGMFFDLKRLGFSQALIKNENNWGVEGEIGKAFYYYVVENFRKAIKTAEGIIAASPTSNVDNFILSEAYNVKGLSERKLVLFDNALKSFDKVIELLADVEEFSAPLDSDVEFEHSLAHLIKSKIFLSTLKFAEANSSCRKALKILQRKIDEMPEGAKRLSNILFIAEENRVFAYGYIWQEEYDAAEEKLSECGRIYEVHTQAVDRYFIRYQYTSLLLQILQKKRENNIYQQLEILRNEIVGLYDAGQINYLFALDVYINHKDDAELVKRGLSYIDKGIDIYDSIDVRLEKNECIMLYCLYCDYLKRTPLIKMDNNVYINQWINYIKSIIIKNSGDEYEG